MDGLVPSYKSAPLIAWSDILFTVHYWKLAQNPSLILNSSEIHLGCLPSIISLGITLSFLLSWNFLNFQMHLFIYSPTFLAVVIGTVDPDDIRQVSSSDLMGSLFVQRSFWCRESFFVCFLNPTNLWRWYLALVITAECVHPPEVIRCFQDFH